MKRLFLLLILAAFATVALPAEDFWVTEEFAHWTDKEVKKILTNSPWAKAQDITLASRMPSGGGGRRGGGGGGRGGGPGGGNMAGGGGQDMSMPSMRVYMRWISALPMRQAIVRTQYGEEVDNPEAQKYLAGRDDGYVLLVAGLPVNMAGGDRGRGVQGKRQDPAEMQKRITENLTASAQLKVKGKAPIQPSQVKLAGTRQEPEIYLVFPRAKDGGFDIVLEDKDVEFQLKMRSGNTIRRKFKLADMVYSGKLEI